MSDMKSRIIKLGLWILALGIILSGISMFFDSRASEKIRAERELREKLEQKYHELEAKTEELHREIETLEEEKAEIQKSLTRANRRYKSVIKGINEGTINEDDFFEAHGYGSKR